MTLKKEDWGINVVGKTGVNAHNDIAFGVDENGDPALRIGETIITENDIGEGVFEKGTGLDSVQQKNTLCEATGECAVATGANTHAGATASHTEGALTTTRNDYDEETETGFDAAYSHVEGLNNAANNVAEHGEGRFGWSYYVDNHDPAKCSIHYVGVGTNNQAEYRKDAEVIMGNGDIYILGIGGYDGKIIEGAQTLQAVVSAGGSGSGLITVVKDLDLTADIQTVGGVEVIEDFYASIDASRFPSDFVSAHDRYNLIVKIYGPSVDEDGNTQELGYTANHFCYMIGKNSEDTTNFLLGTCYDALDYKSSIYHRTTLELSMNDTYELTYEGRINGETSLPEEGSKASVYLQKLY